MNKSSMSSSFESDEKRLFAISDIHVDDEKNMRWVKNLAPKEGDCLIVAGDVSDRLERIEATFELLKKKYSQVMYCPGNHCLWTTEEKETSIEKFEKIMKLAERIGIITEIKVLKGKNRSCVVAPLQSWHHASFDSEPPITQWKGIPSARFVMTDYRRCKWPHPLRDDDSSIAAYMDKLNLPTENKLKQIWDQVDDHITFSHFLPRIELIPEKRYLFLPTLIQAVGSRYLGETVKRITPDVHIFGHSHVAWDATYDGIRYIQAALGYSSEWVQRPISMSIGSLRIPESHNHHQEDARQPLLIWDSANGGIVPETYPTRWSDHYRRFPRVPELTHVLPPYSASIYRPLPGSKVLDVEEHVPPFSS
eukprot:CAMPEP_0197317298 /NCGR_PEP_ID=MMETSP0891-20130614/46347_1 /TAXON_ID=44058 ORGANISM="Aureoumbra lagunensis, Strain CCMP1510" /NCGR_SAMPLE_ID=MMETSP0891 /ASSEMBLY_ACC=CAM_ASM_000534 /LENGTH=363 /DNA_ID=CAMNT_0042807219 /DNA_START=74 /DNA_END=1165 /DNA_ORIENTATION=-